MRDYLKDAQETLGSPRPLSELLAEDRSALLAALVKYLGNSDIYKRKYAAFCLGQIGDTSTLAALQSAFNREPEGGTKEAMGASLATLKKMPASSGSTEAQRCEYVEAVYKGNIPEEIKNFWKEGGQGGGKPSSSAPTVAKASSGGCFTLAIGLFLLCVTVIVVIAH